MSREEYEAWRGADGDGSWVDFKVIRCKEEGDGLDISSIFS